MGSVAERSSLPSFDRQILGEELTRVFSVDMKDIFGLSTSETLEEVCGPQPGALHAGWDPESDQKPRAHYVASAQSA
jgi:hypothetical protein